MSWIKKVFNRMFDIDSVEKNEENKENVRLESDTNLKKNSNKDIISTSDDINIKNKNISNEISDNIDTDTLRNNIKKKLRSINMSESKIEQFMKSINDDNLKFFANNIELINTISSREKERNHGTSSSPISDIKFKKNVSDIPNALDKLLALRGVSFDWRYKEFNEMNFDTKRNIGLIAQNVEEIIPEAIFNHKDGYKCVNYNGLIGLLVESIKEQQVEINRLNKIISKL